MITDIVSYKKDLQVFIDQYGVNFGVNNVDRLIAVVLLCNITQAIRKTTPTTLVIEVINKIVKDDTIATNEFWRKISYQCEALLEGELTQFPDYGYTELKAKTDKIKQINEDVIPF